MNFDNEALENEGNTGGIGPTRYHQEGQYVFLKSADVSEGQWHPFTISSPPHSKYLTVHIRNQVSSFTSLFTIFSLFFVERVKEHGQDEFRQCYKQWHH